MERGFERHRESALLAFGGAGGPGSGAPRSRVRGLEGQPHAVWKEVSLGEEGVRERSRVASRQVAEEGRGARSTPCPSPGQAGGCCPSVGSGPPRSLSFSASCSGHVEGVPQEQTWLQVQLPQVPPLGSEGQQDPWNLTGNLVKVCQAQGGAFLINPPRVDRSSDHTLSSQVLETSFHSHRCPNPNHFA